MRKTGELFALCLTGILPGPVFAQWNAVPSPVPYSYFSVTAYADPNGIACGSTDIVFSSDGWSDWNWSEPIDDATSQPIYGYWKDLHYFDADHAIAVGSVVVWGEYLILRTDNGGLTWHVAMADVLPFLPPLTLNAVDFPSANVGYTGGTNGKLYKTVNAGVDWALLPSPPWGGAEILDIAFWSMDAGIAVTSTDTWTTLNGGTTWISTITDDCRALAIVPGGIGYVLAKDTLYATTDHGFTWTDHAAPNFYPNSIAAPAVDTLHVAGDDGTFRSLDGGLTWSETTGIYGSPLDLYFPNTSMGYAVTHDSVYKITNATDPLPPYAEFHHWIEAICDSSTLHLEAPFVDPAWDLTWELDGVVVGTSTTIDIGFSTTASHSLRFIATNSNGTDSVTKNIYVPVQQEFNVDAGPDLHLCDGQSVVLKGAATPGGTIDAIQWSPAAGLNATTVFLPTCTASSSTDYVLAVTVDACTMRDTVHVTSWDEQLPADTWDTLYLVPTSQNNVEFDMLDDVHGLMARSDGLYATHDGGSSWPLVTAWSNLDSRMCRLTDPFQGYVSSNSRLYRVDLTTNTLISLLYSTFFPPSEVAIVGTDTLLALSGSSFIRRSMDGGGTWATVLPGVNESVTHVLELGGDSVLVVGYDLDSTLVWISADAGTSWTRQALTYYLSTLPYRTSNGWIHLGSRYLSIDGGATWIPRSSQQYMQDIAFITPDTGYAHVGQYGIWKTINAGDCWQPTGFTFANLTHEVTSTPSGAVYALDGSYPGAPSAAIVRRHAPMSPVLDFVIDTTEFCLNTVAHVFHSSVGFDDLYWLLDGTLYTNTDQPLTIDLITPGDHIISLVGIFSGVPDTVERIVNVHAPLPEPSAPYAGETYCWNSAPIPIVVDPVPGAVQYAWYMQSFGPWQTIMGGDTLWQPFNPGVDFSVAAIDDLGCVGLPSDTIEFDGPQNPTTLYPYGPTPVCQDSGSTSVFAYAVAPVEWATGYDWEVAPGEGSFTVVDDTVALVTWDYDAAATWVRVTGTNVCGAGTPRQFSVNVLKVPYFIEQPHDTAVYLGQPVQFSVDASATNFTEAHWYRNGTQVSSGSTSYSIPSAAVIHEGAYNWVAYYACDTLQSDTAWLTVMPVGIEEGDGPDGWSVWPTLFSDQVRISVPGSSSFTAELIDAQGRMIGRWDRITEGSFVLRLNDLAPGTYHLAVRAGDRARVFPLVKLAAGR